MENKNHFLKGVENLLQNEEFIEWRIFKTNELDEYWLKFRKQNPHLDKELDEAIIQFEDVKINHFPLTDLEKKQIHKKINDKIKHYKRRMWFLRMGSVAAAVVIGILSILFTRNIRDTNIVLNEEIETIVGQTLPEEDVHIITNGKKIELSNKTHIGLKEDGIAIITDSTTSKKELLLTKKQLNKLVVPFGKRSQLTLADGSEVWLNSGTKLDFPSEFRGKSRDIYVDGEIYIDVAFDDNTPFIVHTGDMDVVVMGTEFNLTAYKEDGRKTIVLVEGKVRIETNNNYQTELNPNEKIELNNNSVSKERVDVAEYISWKDGMLVFNSTPMSDILKRIGRYYNVEFEKAQDITLNDKNFSGKLFLSNSLDSVMTSISTLSSTKYIREENKIFISKK